MGELLTADESTQGWLGRLVGEQGIPYGLPLNATVTALSNVLVVKAGAGTLLGFTGFNSKVAAQFIQVFDATQVPADGAVPVVVLTVPTVANFAASFGTFGRTFEQGIIICNSSTLATKTIGAADTWIDAQYV